MKCKNCGTTIAYHAIDNTCPKITKVWGDSKFEVEDENLKPFTNLRGSSLKTGKQKKGCGKRIKGYRGYNSIKCGDNLINPVEIVLCPSCQNQSPVAYGSVGKAEPVIGTQSPQEKSLPKLFEPEGTKTLSDAIELEDAEDIDGDICWNEPTEDYLFVSDVKTFISKLKDDLKKVFCSGFVSLSEECFEREWEKSTDKLAGPKLI